jgi:hypothetical protein
MNINKIITIILLLLSSHALAEKTDIVQAYTMEQMYEMAELYKSMSENKSLGEYDYINYVNAGQFRGYVGALLDSSINTNKMVVDCAKRRSLNFIAYRVAQLITMKPIDRSNLPIASMLFSVMWACDDSKWTTNK